MNPKKKKNNSKSNPSPTAKTDVEIIPRPEEYPLIRSGEAMAEVLHLIDENLGPQKFSVLNLPRIKVPAGGGTEFRVEGPAGAELARQLPVVIPAFRLARIFWKKAFGTGGGKKPPDCTSTDGFTGIGDPGGECSKCPNAVFGTSINPDGSRGTGQACKEIRQLLVLLPGQLLPHILSVPPTSIRNFLQYSMNLVSAGVTYWGVVTKLSLEPATSTAGIDFARISFSLERRLEKEQIAMLEPYHQRMRGFLQPMIVDATAYEINGEKSEPASTDSEVPF
jgi:hypothetical protein